MYRSTASDDGAIMNQVQATHAPHGREIVVDPLINITEQILIQAIACSTGDVHGRGEKSETSKKATELDTNDTSMIQKLSRESLFHHHEASLSLKVNRG
ncbi:hypothetical protein L6164_033187 [Bauhinia variegata]|uniref:Uncharacterized protein n=1 Tax=Bauhinia variegata TaxID=167791 RepID=A0ACB9KRT7_BAUVA|nr:hypothetical protein L6164_033187 [Bauhinia variegata]